MYTSCLLFISWSEYFVIPATSVKSSVWQSWHHRVISRCLTSLLLSIVLSVTSLVVSPGLSCWLLSHFFSSSFWERSSRGIIVSWLRCKELFQAKQGFLTVRISLFVSVDGLSSAGTLSFLWPGSESELTSNTVQNQNWSLILSQIWSHQFVSLFFFWHLHDCVLMLLYFGLSFQDIRLCKVYHWFVKDNSINIFCLK